VRNWEDAERGVELMRGELNGRATFLAEHADEQASSLEWPQPGAPEGTLTKLTDALRFTNGLSGLSTQLVPRIANCYIATERTLARQLAMQFPH
jgi:chromosome segregation protein